MSANTHDDAEYEAGPDQLEEKLANLDEELADQRAVALRASLSDYELDEEDDELLAGCPTYAEIVDSQLSVEEVLA